MRMGRWARRLLLAAAPVAVCLSAGLLAGCGDFWQAPGGGGSTSFTLANSGAISVNPGSTNTAVITVTPANSFSGAVALTCAVTTSPSGAANLPTCNLNPTSVTISGTTAQTSTLTAATAAGTTTGAYQITVTGVSGSVTETTAVCVEVGSSSGGCSNSAGTSGNFYILNSILNSSTISGYSINAGTLTALSGSPTALPAGVTPWAMAIDPTGKFLYVSTSGGIFLYDIGSGGALTLQNSSLAVLPDLSGYALRVDSTGHWLLDASNTLGGPILYAWPISTANGEPTLANGVTAPAEPLVSGGSVGMGGIAISPDNKLVAVAVGSATQTFTFKSGTDFTGATNPLAGTVYKTNGVGVAVSVAFSPQTSFLYIGETGVPAFASYNKDSAGLRIIPITSDVLGTEPSASPYQSGGTGPHAILATSNGYVYVANWVGTGSGNITAFLLNASGPALKLQSNPVATGTDPYGMVEDSSDSYVLAVSNSGGPEFNAYTFDATTTGQLDSSLTGSTGTGPIAIVAVP